MTNVSEIKKGKTTFSGSYPEPLVDEIKFKIVQLCYGVFGQGTTFDEACEDAVEWLESVSNAEEVKAILVERHKALDGDMTMLNIDDHEDFHDYYEGSY